MLLRIVRLVFMVTLLAILLGTAYYSLDLSLRQSRRLQKENHYAEVFAKGSYEQTCAAMKEMEESLQDHEELFLKMLSPEFEATEHFKWRNKLIAISALAKIQSPTSIDALMRHAAWCGGLGHSEDILEEFPAAEGLIQIGPNALVAILNRDHTKDSPDELFIFAAVICRIERSHRLFDTIARRLAESSDPTETKSLEALKKAYDLVEEHGIDLLLFDEMNEPMPEPEFY